MKYFHTILSDYFFLIYIVDYFVSTESSYSGSMVTNPHSSTADPHTVGQHWIHSQKAIGWKLPNENKHVMFTRNEVQCLLSCHLIRTGCSAVYYKKAEMRCKHLWGNTHVLMTEGTSNDVVIISPSLTSIYATTRYNNHTGRTFDFAKASSVCEGFAGKLASRTELEALYADGVRHCWCGWLSDGTQGYVNQGVWDRCSTIANTGTHYDCDLSPAHAWCTITGLHG